MYSNAKQSSFITFSFTLLYNSIAILEEKHLLLSGKPFPHIKVKG